jgi:predicted DNA-binding WGR domain protein
MGTDDGRALAALAVAGAALVDALRKRGSSLKSVVRAKPQISDLLRLEYHDDYKNSHKFYEWVTMTDGTHLVRWGRIDTKGQSQTVTRDEAKKRVDEKIRKGYRVVA